MSDKVDIQKLSDLIATMGKVRSKRFLSTLKKESKIYSALSTEVGQTLLASAMSRIEDLLNKIAMDESTEEERAEYRALKKIVEKWAIELDSYKQKILTIV